MPSLFPEPYVEFEFSLECDGDFQEECSLEFAIVGNFSQTYSFFARNRVRHTTLLLF